MAPPVSSSIAPKRFMGVRIFNSRPRAVCRISSPFSAVGKTPGAIALTQILWGASSMANDLVSAPTPALLTPYAATWLKPTKVVSEAMFRILPKPWVTIVLPKIWQHLQVPFRFISMTLFQPSSVHSSVGVLSVMPAAFTRMSTFLKVSRTLCCSASMEGRLRISTVARSVRRPRASISAATFCVSSGGGEAATTSAPASAIPRATALPKPDVPPMTTAHLPVRSNRLEPNVYSKMRTKKDDPAAYHDEPYPGAGQVQDDHVDRRSF